MKPITISTDVDVEDIGKSFADSTSDIQAQLLNSMCEFWRMLYKGNIQASNSQSQMCWIIGELNPAALEWLVDMGEFAKLQKDKK